MMTLCEQTDYLVDVGLVQVIMVVKSSLVAHQVKVMKDKKSLTGQYLSGKKRIDVPEHRREVTDRKISIKGARSNNLKGVDVDIPLSVMTVVTGVSGSVKVH